MASGGKRVMKKFLAVLAALLIFPSMSAALELPNKINEWIAAGENIVPLITKPDNIKINRSHNKNNFFVYFIIFP